LALLASLWKSCFAETIDKHLGLPMTGAGYIFSYSEIGLNLKDPGRRLPGFCISPQVRESCREAVVSRPKILVLLESVLGRGNHGVDHAGELNEGAVACILDDTSVMLSDFGIEKRLSESFQLRQRAFFVDPY
jgi:hypothetical protein